MEIKGVLITKMKLQIGSKEAQNKAVSGVSRPSTQVHSNPYVVIEWDRVDSPDSLDRKLIKVDRKYDYFKIYERE